MNILDKLRKLAKSDYYQSVFVAVKELNGTELFKNKMDLTSIQISFINWLMFYYNINQEIYSNEVSELVITDFIYEDAYSYWKRKASKEFYTKEINKKDNKYCPDKKQDLKIVFPQR